MLVYGRTLVKRAVWIVLVLCRLSTPVHAESPTLALYIKQNESLPFELTQTAQSELRRVFDSVGIDVVWRDFSGRTAGEDFDFVAIASISGSCTPSEQRANVRSTPQKLVSLADTSVSKKEIFPFFTVNCNHLIAAMGRQTSPSMLGRAMARLMGHELYHIIAKTTDHQQAGIAKAVFTLEDLVNPGLEFDFRAQARMRSPLSIARSSRRLPSNRKSAS
jgi:hypothetical protein